MFVVAYSLILSYIQNLACWHDGQGVYRPRCGLSSNHIVVRVLPSYYNSQRKKIILSKNNNLVDLISLLTIETTKS